MVTFSIYEIYFYFENIFGHNAATVESLILTLCQHSSMMSYSAGGQPWGDCIRYPCSTWWRTSAFVIPGEKKIVSHRIIRSHHHRPDGLPG